MSKITIESKLDYPYLKNRTKEQLIDIIFMSLEENDRLRECAQWMSGSNDFAPEGCAHEGWLKWREFVGTPSRCGSCGAESITGETIWH